MTFTCDTDKDIKNKEATSRQHVDERPCQSGFATRFPSKAEVGTMLLAALEKLAHLYSVWVLFGVIAFVTHLGEDIPELAFLFPGGAGGGNVHFVEKMRDGQQGARSMNIATSSVSRSSFWGRKILEYLTHNVPLAATFVIPHTGLPILYRLANTKGSWLCCNRNLPISKTTFLFWYNLHSAASLHFLLAFYRGIDSSLLVDLSTVMLGRTHFTLVLPVIVVAYALFLSDGIGRRMLFPRIVTRSVLKIDHVDEQNNLLNDDDKQERQQHDHDRGRRFSSVSGEQNACWKSREQEDTHLDKTCQQACVSKTSVGSTCSIYDEPDSGSSAKKTNSDAHTSDEDVKEKKNFSNDRFHHNGTVPPNRLTSSCPLSVVRQLLTNSLSQKRVDRDDVTAVVTNSHIRGTHILHDDATTVLQQTRNDSTFSLRRTELVSKQLCRQGNGTSPTILSRRQEDSSDNSSPKFILCQGKTPNEETKASSTSAFSIRTSAITRTSSTSQATCSSQSRRGNLDIITAMATAVTQSRFGVLGFILFSGLSIIPLRFSLDDLILRVSAAVYLRVRSPAFRRFSLKIAQTHYVIWLLRALVLLLFCGVGGASGGTDQIIGTMVNKMLLFYEQQSYNKYVIGGENNVEQASGDELSGVESGLRDGGFCKSGMPVPVGGATASLRYTKADYDASSFTSFGLHLLNKQPRENFDEDTTGSILHVGGSNNLFSSSFMMSPLLAFHEHGYGDGAFSSSCMGVLVFLCSRLPQLLVAFCVAMIMLRLDRL